ncbi:hypothetical protein ACIQCD_12740 [Streptomyces sp. NPDC093250]|uniref:hypothetical protein n=1 Tax=unclassified Streptomyces TaxID=2593676 RepID=UPI003414630A
MPSNLLAPAGPGGPAPRLDGGLLAAITTYALDVHDVHIPENKAQLALLTRQVAFGG